MNIDIDKFIKVRKQLKLTQAMLSNGICTQTTLSKFERQKQIPAVDIIAALCERLGLTLDDIFALKHVKFNKEKVYLKNLWHAVGVQNALLFDAEVHTCRLLHLSFSGEQLFNLALYFDAVVWHQNKAVANQLFKKITVPTENAEQQYAFYAITAHHYLSVGRQQAAGQIMSDLQRYKNSIMTEEYSIVKIVTIYMIADYYRLMREHQNAAIWAANGIILSHQYGVTYLLENLFWIMLDGNESWSGQAFVTAELSEKIRVLAKMHGNQDILKKINQTNVGEL